MSTSIDIHMHSKDTVIIDEVKGSETIYLMVEDPDGNSVTLYFPSINDVRMFLAKALNELRQLEQGDIPYSPHNDKVEVTT